MTARLSAAVFAVSFGIAALGGWASYRTASAALRERVSRQLETDATEEAQSAAQWLAQQQSLMQLEAARWSESDTPLPTDIDRNAFRPALAPVLDVEEVQQILVPGGLVVRSTDSTSLGRYAVEEEFYLEGRRGTYIQKIYLSATTGRPRLTIAAPIRRNGTTVGLLAGHLDLTRMEAVVRHPVSLSLPTDAYLVNRFAEFVSAQRFGRDGVSRGVHSLAIDLALKGGTGTGIYDDYAGRAVLGAWRWIPELELALVVETPLAAALAPARKLLTETLLLGLVATALLALGVTAITRRFTAPVLSVANAASKVAAGNFGVRTPVTGDDEVGQLADAFNVMTEQLDSLYGRLESQVQATQTALVEAQSSRALLQDLVNNTATLVLVVGLDDRILLANARVALLTGVPAGAASERMLPDLFGESTSLIASLLARSRAMDGVVEQEVELELLGGTHGWQMVAFPLLRDDGTTYATGLIGTDLTERARAEAERRARDASVQQAQKLESLGIMAGGIAHDFNNILGAIIGNADLARETVADESETAQALDRITVSSRRASELTRQMLAYAGRASLRREVVDAREIIRDILPMVQASHSKKVELDVAAMPDALWVELDPAQLSQVFLNLLTNAVEAIGDHPGRVSVRAAACEAPEAQNLDTTAPHGWWQLSVEDTGTGIPDVVRARIFDPFFTTKSSGRGLGLSAVRGIIGTLDGVLALAHTGADGTRFDIFLRQAAAPATAEGRHSAPPRTALSGTLLVVDDEAPIREVAARVARRMGLSVVEAENGAQGLEQFRRHAAKVSVVLLDLTMPGMGGAEVLATLRTSHPTLPVIIVSGYDRDDALTQISDDPATRFLAKPFGVGTLRDQIIEMMQR
ncbi:response regulator [Gemmatimonas phototrophica]|uniref:response regulator n=1 Tax=Gemmatimonas phototrophica TaxID=1379270 RepID=UPI000A65FDF1|nr:response regulator [Gemmatimonas phototrophica]